MAVNFTEEQLKAIETTDRSVLVSASAGSGKTAVLIERIIRIIIDGKANVDEMLVVTFTDAAASEMRLRLSKAIRARMAECPDDAPRMKEQLNRLYKAYISTIDSFALRVIREFFHETDLEPGFAIADDVQTALLRSETASELFEDAFQNDQLIEGGSFREFLRLYSSDRSDEGFIQDMLSAYSRLRSMPDYFEWAHEKAELLKTTPETFEGSELQRMMAEDAAETFETAYEAMREVCLILDIAGLEDMVFKLDDQYNAIIYVYGEAQSGFLSRDAIRKIENMPSPRLYAKKNEKEAYELVHKEVNELRTIIRNEIAGFKNRYLIPDFHTRLAEMNASFKYTVYYLNLLEEFEKRYDEKKRERGVLDFADLEHIAAGILKNDEAADILRSRFKYIFVDEYQDTSNIQETLINRVSRPDNVFKVGDLKQSIYRFRQAEPAIFERLYAKYSKGEDSDGTVVDLGYNFRTNDKTIRYINRVFRNIMEGYDERAMLRTGAKCPPEYDFTPEFHLLLEDEGNTGDILNDPGHGKGADGDLTDDEIAELTKEEAEAGYIAELAESIIGTEFYDTKINAVREAKPGDITILFRAVKYRGEVMERALRERGVNSRIEESGDYFDTLEINIALSLLKCIDNMKRDVPLISLLHSEIFGLEPRELAEIRTAHRDHLRENPADRDVSKEGSPHRGPAYWEAFEWFAQSGPNGELKDKLADARSKIYKWRELSRIMPLEDFIWKVLVDSGYYRTAGAMSGGAERQANLRLLADKAGTFSRNSVANLSSFINFIELMKKSGLKTANISAAVGDDSAVRISTIHKSKGLEYPFVIVGGLGHRFRMDSNTKGFSFDSGAGIGLPYVDPGRRYWRSTVMQRAINSKSRRDGYKEELRLLYVAMTRARNKLLLVGCCKSEEDLKKIAPRPSSYVKAMRDVVRTEDNLFFASPLNLSAGPEKSGLSEAKDSERSGAPDAVETKLYNEIDRRFSYKYPDADLLTAREKYSVSELRREENGRGVERGLHDANLSDENITEPAETDAELSVLLKGSELRKQASGTDTGIAYHRIMEFIDFENAAGRNGEIDRAYIKERAAFLHEHEAIEDDVFNAIDTERIAAFFATDLGKRAAEASARGSLKKERPFTLKTVRNGREMLVQGVIDCCFEEDGRMILIDYKSGLIRPGADHEEELKRIYSEYRVQIEIYSEAIEKGTGLEVGEAYLYLFATGEALKMK